jgi:hypothetical protein
MREKAEQLNEKDKRRQEKVENKDYQLRIACLKHKELDNLRFQDNKE